MSNTVKHPVSQPVEHLVLQSHVQCLEIYYCRVLSFEKHKSNNSVAIPIRVLAVLRSFGSRLWLIHREVAFVPAVPQKIAQAGRKGKGCLNRASGN